MVLQASARRKTKEMVRLPDRLNELFTPAGWTRDDTVQLVQNFERKERGSAERTIKAKIVVKCKVTIHCFVAHTGLSEEWADNDNAGTAAEAQAFKRACSCFGLGRYLLTWKDSGWIWTRKSAHWRRHGFPIGHGRRANKVPSWADRRITQTATVRHGT